jgi:UDP-N-acetylglucosamine acyltransferase
MDVPPYCMVTGARGELAGLNTVGLQRAGMTEEQVGRVKQAYKIMFRSNLGLAEGLAQLESELGGHPEIAHFIQFVKGSQRGITR